MQISDDLMMGLVFPGGSGNVDGPSPMATGVGPNATRIGAVGVTQA